MLLSAISLALLIAVPGPAHTFGYDHQNFLLDGKPFQIRCGEMHYMRVPREYWRQRMRMAKAMGLNTIGTYVFWNGHEPEPGKFDFSGNNDVAQFIKDAQAEGLYVMLRPGPYSCAEWEFGGYPWWLYNVSKEIRSSDKPYLDACHKFILRLGRELKGLQITKGGPILMVQVENEYGSFGKDLNYMASIRDMLREAGFEVPLYTVDGPGDGYLGYLKSGLADTLTVINFDGDPDKHFTESAKYIGDKPKMCGEFYPGWFDSWGGKHNKTSVEGSVPQLAKLVEKGYSFSFYMFHGGTTFGFMNGANWYDNKHMPQTSCYDYDAPLDEAGRPTEKFMAFRKTIQDRIKDKLPDVPPAPKTIELPPVSLADSASLLEVVSHPTVAAHPIGFEELGIGYGYVLYRTTLRSAAKGTLQIKGLRDRANILANGSPIGVLWRNAETSMKIDLPAGTQLDILVENLGRINYSMMLRQDQKGIREGVFLDDREVIGWSMFPIPLTTLEGYKWSATPKVGPTLFRAEFSLNKPADTFLDMRGWGKGVVFVNGKNLGRFWRIGPQQTLYCPGVWLRRGKNEIVVLDTDQSVHHTVCGLKNQVFGN